MDSVLKPILDSLTRQLGDSGTIMQAKALQFANNQQISFNECERNLELLNTLNLYGNNEIKKMKMTSILHYFQAETNPEKAATFLAKYEQWHNNNKINLRSANNIDHLHLIFNVIEFENRFRIMNAEKLKLISIQLFIYEKFEKCFEDFILFKYYDGVLKYLLGDYQSAKVSVMEIVIDLCEEISEKKSSFIEFIELKNSILTLQILERENGSKEIVSHLESLCETYCKKDNALSIKFAIKMCDFYLAAYEFDKVFILLHQIFKKIKTQINFSNKKFPEFVEIQLNTISRVIFCTIMFGRSEEAAKFLKKMEKLITYLREHEVKNDIDSEAKEILLARYQFVLLISRLILQNKLNSINKSDLNTCISEYRTKFKNTILSEDDVIINIYSLNSSDLLAKNFFDKIAYNMSLIQGNKLVSVNYISLFFSIYNQIAILTKNVTTDTNLKKQLEYIEKIRNCSKAVTEYVEKYCDFVEMKIIFSLPYFKQVLIKTIYSFLYSFFFVREYKKCLEFLNDAQIISDKLELNKGGIVRYYAEIFKLKADSLFKLEDYEGAINEYSKVMKIHEEYNNQIGVALVSFDLGIVCCYAKEYELAKNHLMSSLNKFDFLNSSNQNRFIEKVNHINTLIQKLNSTLFSRIN
jgi:hypothetical protein